MSDRPIILLGEPEEATRDSMEMILMDEGFDCHTIRDKDSLLRAMESHPSDLIIVDAGLIYSNPEPFISRLESYPKRPPVLVILPYEMTHAIIILNKLGVDDYVFKPFQFDDLVMRVQQLLQPPPDR